MKKNENPTDTPVRFSLEEIASLHEIEGSPLSHEQLQMFDMFEREGWSPEQRRTYIRNRTLSEIGGDAAE